MSKNNPDPNLPIGVFDSGVGGLTVLGALRSALPNENFIYLGDTARLPYGTKGADTVTRYALGAAKLLVERGVKLLVIACNTASAVALPALAKAFAPLKVVGVIEAGAQAAVEATTSGSILVTATAGTVRGQAYQHAIASRASKLVVKAVACPVFVALAEEGWGDTDIAKASAKRYLAPYLGKSGAQPPVKTLVLGCTHFPLLRPSIEFALKELHFEPVTVVDSARTTARQVQAQLVSQGIATPRKDLGEVQYLATDDVERFCSAATPFLNTSLASSDVHWVDLA